MEARSGPGNIEDPVFIGDGRLEVVIVPAD